MIDAVIYGVILKANIVKLLKAPPENKSNKPNSPVSPLKTSARTALSIPGTGIFEPNLKTANINNVNMILFLISGIFQARAIVFIIPILDHLCLSSGRFDLFKCCFTELLSSNGNFLFKSTFSKYLYSSLYLLYKSNPVSYTHLTLPTKRIV